MDDALSGMIIIRGRTPSLHERKLRGSDVSRGDFNPGVITFDVILILCVSVTLRLCDLGPLALPCGRARTSALGIGAASFDCEALAEQAKI